MISNQAKFLAAAFKVLVGPPAPGNIAFVRCLPNDAVAPLVAHADFTVPGWQIFAVAGAHNNAAKIIPADRAVELREDKGPATLLLVDVSSAGAGMDGIYNAAKEISESDLFDKAISMARRALPRTAIEAAKEAVRRANKLGRRHTVSPWREFEFYCVCSENAGNMGCALPTLGLWPVAFGAEPDFRDIETSATMVERLFLTPTSSKTASTRIEALMLQDETAAQRSDLERVLRQAGGKPIDAVLTEIAALPHLWLNNIKPSFATNRLKRIELMKWYGATGKLLKGSGLQTLDGDDMPHLILSKDGESSTLSVQWKTQPDGIAKGEVSYEISIVAASDVLASKNVDHRENPPQKINFSVDDFEELDEASKFTAQVVVRAVGADGVEDAKSEEFNIVFGDVGTQTAHQGSGDTYRCAVEGAINLESREELVAFCKARGEGNHYREDNKSFVIMRANSKIRCFRVFRPPLIKMVEDQWSAMTGAIGRWTIQVRADGTRSGEPIFHAIERGDCTEAKWARLLNVSRLYCEETLQGQGMMSRIYLQDESSSNRTVDYINAWEDALKEGGAELALANTLEVRDVAGRTIGLIVLPHHAMRVAWQAAYDALAVYARYDCSMKPKDVREALAVLDSSHFPSMLPGLEQGGSFVFADTLGLTATAMVRDNDREPKAAVSIMALCLGADVPEIAPSVGRQTASVLAKELRNYLKHHAHNRLVQLHALRPGDGATVVRALGMALQRSGEKTSEDESKSVLEDLAFSLNLYPSSAQQAVAGRFLTQLSQRRRSGSGRIDPGDAWVLEPLACGGNRTLPRLRWSRRHSLAPSEPAHLSLAFDTFVSKVVADARTFESRPLHAYGLIANFERTFTFAGDVPIWEATINPEQDGEKHPSTRTGIVTERLNRVHAAVLRSVAKSLGCSGGWPLLRTELNGEEVETLKTLHRLSDWVVTVDRNAGIEYFDSPRDAATVYETYVIDAVPERDDLGCLQMITSTSHLDEVRGLLDQALAFMGLSSSLKNCTFLLRELKALSGRLAMRLASATTEAHAKTSGELVALALARAQCGHQKNEHPCWLSLDDGFLVPLDDIRDILPAMKTTEGEEEIDTRADMLYVAAPGRSGLTFRFIEVKYRRHLSLARSLELVQKVGEQTSASSQNWREWYFGAECSPVVRSLRRSRLARALRFYLDKGRRHHLSPEVFKRLSQELEKMLRTPGVYEPVNIDKPNRGYIFCPEFSQREPERLFPDESDDTAIFLFGPAEMPNAGAHEIQSATPSTSAEQDGNDGGDAETLGVQATTPAPLNTATTPGNSPTLVTPEQVNISLGKVHGSETPVHWSVSIKGNPHLMMVGLPGMGKTTCLVSLCKQLSSAGITPIVFSYHDDIDGKLADCFPDLRKSDCQSLGFNPMRVTASGPFGHIESAGLLRDIFAAIFPELGDLQLETIREAIKSSYKAHGWEPSSGGEPMPPPPFRAFFKKLLSSGRNDNRTQTLLARLTELDDFHFFNDSGTGQGLLDETSPLVLQIHKTMSAAVQQAYASFAFYRIYQDMFRRGQQSRITHAVIFDEAHRASRLKLIPTMAKECRKYGLALVVASQEAKDFDTSLFSAIANYLILRVTENDAKALARNVAPSDMERRVADRLKQIEKYQALYFCEGKRNQVHVDLTESVS